MAESLPPFLENWPDGEACREFYRSLSEPDRQVLDDLFARADMQSFAIRNSQHPLPYLVSLLSLLIEEHKEIARLKREVRLSTPEDE